MNTTSNLKTIMVHSYKGGTGKTAISVNLALYLATVQKKKVLLIEQDIHGPSFVNIFRIKPKLFWNDFYQPSTALLQDMITHWDHLDVICSRESEIEIPMGEDTNKFYNRQLQRLKMQQQRYLSEYDYVIIDTTPGYSRELINNLIICDSAILITRLDTDTVTKTIDMYDLVYSNFKNRKIVLVQNQVPTPVEVSVSERMDIDVKRTQEEWKKFIDGKEVINIPYTNEIAYSLFISKIVPTENPFIEYIKKIVNYL